MDELKMHAFPFSAERNSKAFKFPRWYSDFIKIKTPSKVYLKGPSGGTWAVELVRKDGMLYFKQGWNEFQTCHSLRDKDLLIFGYDGNVCFKVKIYQEKFGEDINEERLQVNPSPAHSEGTQNAAQPQPAVRRETKENRATDSVDQDSLSFVQTVKRSLMTMPSWFVKKHLSGYGDKIEVVLENTRRQQWPVTIVCTSNTMLAGWSQFARDNRIKEGDTCKFVFVRRLTMLVHISPKKDSSQELERQANPEKTQLRSATRRVLKHADDNEAREHKLPEKVACDFPSFTVSMKPYNVHRPGIINMSAKFVSTHCCNYGHKATITLENEQDFSTLRDLINSVHDTLIGMMQEEDPRIKPEHPTCNTDRKRRSDGVNKRKRGSEKEDIAMQVAAATGDIAELREANRKILQLLQEMNNSGAK